MSKNEALEHFLKNGAANCSQQFVVGMTEYLKKENRALSVDQLTEALKQLLNDCVENNTIELVRYIQISLMRSKAMTGEAFYRLESYGENFFLDEPYTSRVLDFPWIYGGYKTFCMSIDRESRKYVGKIASEELKRIKLIELISCNKVIKMLLGDSVIDLMITDEFRALSIDKGVQVQMGDYRGEYDLIIKTDAHTANIGELLHGIL